MEITSSSVSVYEIVLDLEQWQGLRTNRIPGFVDALIRFLPSTVQHKCVAGREGGFHEQLMQGTNLAHVVEHVLLEFLHLTDPAGREFSGWTRELGGGVFKIHYGAPGLLEGRLAPILATDAVRRLQAGETPDLEPYLADLRDPRAYFMRHGRRADDVADPNAPGSPAASEPTWPAGPRQAPLGPRQQERIARLFDLLDRRLPDIDAAWRRAFFAFGGEFSRGIVDKVEILNPDRFRDALRRADVDAYLDGVAGLCRMIRDLRIPKTFVTHAAWLYKNQLQLAILELLADQPATRAMAIGELDALYGGVLAATEAGYGAAPEKRHAVDERVVSGFRARQVRPSRVLVVDDDSMARSAICDILGYRGIPALGAENGLEALRALEAHRFEIAVVILDRVLPDMDGLAVCRRIRDGYPQVRVVLTSGYSLDRATDRCLADHEVCFLGKPFDSASLIATVRDLLDLDRVGARAGRS